MTQSEANTDAGCEQISQRLSELRYSFDDAIRQAPCAQAAPGQEFLLLTLSGETYAFPITHTLEVLQVPTIVPVPGLKPSVRGIINFRGQVLFVTTIHAALALSLGDPSSAGRIIVTKGLGAAVGILVDAVKGIAEIATEEIHSVPVTMGEDQKRILAGQVYADGVLMSIVDVRQLYEIGALDVGRPQAGA